MTTNFPSGLDSFNNPTANSTMDDHVAQHNDATDALDALEYKVGETGTGASHTLWYKAENVNTNQISDGAVTQAKLIEAVERLLVPAGTMQDFAGETVPNGWLALEGQTIANADTTYPSLWAVAPSAWKSGSSLTLVDARGKYFFMTNSVNDAGSTGGSNTATLTAVASHVHYPYHEHSWNLPSHSHPSPSENSETANHAHNVNFITGNNNASLPRSSAGVQRFLLGTAGNFTSGTPNATTSSSFTSNADQNNTIATSVNFQSHSPSGIGVTLDPQHILFKKIIKAH